MKLYYKDADYIYPDTDKKISCIYLLELSGKKYVGQTKDIRDRISKHKKDSLKLKTRLYYAIRKYGWSNVTFTILEEVASEQLNEREKYWANVYDVYNKKIGLNTAICGANNPMDNLEIRKRHSKRLIKALAPKVKERERIAKEAKRFIVYTLLSNKWLLDSYIQKLQEKLAKANQPTTTAITKQRGILSILPHTFNYPEYKHIIGDRGNINKMERYNLIYPIGMQNGIISFVKGARPQGYIRDIAVMSNKAKKLRAPKIHPDSMVAMNKEYSTLYMAAKKADSSYTTEQHRLLHYERIYGRAYIP